MTKPLIYWQGRDAREMSNEELIDVIWQLYQEMESLRKERTRLSIENVRILANVARRRSLFT